MSTGERFLSAYNSDTYHLRTIASFCEYIKLSNDTTFGSRYWSQIVRGIKATFLFTNTATNLFHGTKTADLVRVGQGGANTALNAIYHPPLSHP